MKTHIIEQNGHRVAVVENDGILMPDPQTALDFMMNTNIDTGSTRIVMSKDLLPEDFFVLSSGLAGEILQKFVNYRMKLAIYGDFSGYTSKPLHDFMYESNKGRDIFFASDLEDALNRITAL